ncbi:UNC93-like protein like [Argiope bruennichi]|uniref:UNC93-like protein like n=1 Tax=Argiope bruennichi TaxID=94029 RepID=A0A8T0FQ58_ARGBR|nr:UNC93-like protein like [Argiope bruennichi]
MEHSNQVRDLSKLRIVKNLIVLSASYLLISIAYEGLLLLQTTMNKEKGIGTVSAAVNYIFYGISSLLFSNLIIKKCGAKNAQLLGAILYLPFIASNLYPTWFTMIPSAILRGIGCNLVLTAHAIYINESSILFCKTEKDSNASKCISNIETQNKDSGYDKVIKTLKSDQQKIEELSDNHLVNKTDGRTSGRNSKCFTGALPITLTAYRGRINSLPENNCISKEMNTNTTTAVINGQKLIIVNDSGFSKTSVNVSDERKEKLFLEPFTENINVSQQTCQSYVNSTKAFFFGIYGLLYFTAFIWSNLITHYVLKTNEIENYNKTSSCSCGAGFCSTNHDCLSNSIEEVSDPTRHLLTSLFVACAVLAIFPIFLLDRIDRDRRHLPMSWDHIWATFKSMKDKNHLLLMPFTISTTISRGYYMADFTKSYIACAWSLSQVGLITVIYGVASSLSAIFSSVLIKYIGRRCVIILCQIINMANFVFLFMWSPNAQETYLFYLQGCIFGIIAGIYYSQTRAFYGILFEGDEATAYSACNLFFSIGWALPFIYNDLFCNSVKIYILLAFSSIGLLGYLLSERSYSLKKRQMASK